MTKFIDGLEYIRTVRPIVVCGAARSGTRMVTDILNSHESIAIQEEMHAKTLEKYFDFIGDVQDIFDSYSERKGRRVDRSWVYSKDILTHVFLGCANKKEFEGKGKELLYHGIKTPGYERYFDSFEEIFRRSPPIYIYCVRDVGKVWRSWRSIGYLDDLELFSTRYQRSLRQALNIKKNAEGRFLLFDLDDYVVSERKSDFVANVIFHKLGLGVDDDLSSLLDNVPNRNSIKMKGESYIVDDGLEEQIEALRNSVKIQGLKSDLKK